MSVAVVHPGFAGAGATTTMTVRKSQSAPPAGQKKRPHDRAALDEIIDHNVGKYEIHAPLELLLLIDLKLDGDVVHAYLAGAKSPLIADGMQGRLIQQRPAARLGNLGRLHLPILADPERTTTVPCSGPGSPPADTPGRAADLRQRQTSDAAPAARWAPLTPPPALRGASETRAGPCTGTAKATTGLGIATACNDGVAARRKLRWLRHRR